jgi:hypothetical protein
VAIIKRNIFWDVMPCSLVEATDMSASTFCVCLAYSSTPITQAVHSSEMAVHFYCVTPQKTELFINTVLFCVVTLQSGKYYHCIR